MEGYFILLVIILIPAMYMDSKYGRIPNYLTIGGVLIGISYHLIIHGTTGLIFSLKGLSIGFFLLIILYLFGAIGGGDVKLFAAIGALTGMSFVINSLVYSILYGGMIGLLILLYKKEFTQRMVHVLYHLFGIIFLHQLQSIKDYKDNGSYRFPFMYAVIPGVITAYFYFH